LSDEIEAGIEADLSARLRRNASRVRGVQRGQLRQVPRLHLIEHVDNMPGILRSV